MNDPKHVKVRHTGHNPGKLEIVDERANDRSTVADILTSLKRFTSRLNLVNRMISPFGIQSVRMSKQFEPGAL